MYPSKKFVLLTFLTLVLGVAALVLGPADRGHAQQVHRNGFEGRETAWMKGPADAAFHETLHEMTDLTAHTGQFSEHIELAAEQGSYIYYVYPVGRAPIGDELT